MSSPWMGGSWLGSIKKSCLWISCFGARGERGAPPLSPFFTPFPTLKQQQKEGKEEAKSTVRYLSGYCWFKESRSKLGQSTFCSWSNTLELSLAIHWLQTRSLGSPVPVMKSESDASVWKKTWTAAQDQWILHPSRIRWQLGTVVGESPDTSSGIRTHFQVSGTWTAETDLYIQYIYICRGTKVKVTVQEPSKYNKRWTITHKEEGDWN